MSPKKNPQSRQKKSSPQQTAGDPSGRANATKSPVDSAASGPSEATPIKSRSAGIKPGNGLKLAIGSAIVGIVVAGYLLNKPSSDAPEAPAAPSSSEPGNQFVRVDGARFMIGDKPYTFAGVNFWQGAYLGAEVVPGGKARLRRELDLLSKNGVTNLRITAAAEKSKIERSLRPAFMERPGEYNETLLAGLDVLLDEMAKRDMKAVMVMGNYWEWSGGMAQLVAWADNKPPVDPLTSHIFQFMSSSAGFYANKKAQRIYQDYLKHVTQRENSVNGIRYADDPTIMTWELANEPRPHPLGRRSPGHIGDFLAWIDSTAETFHAFAPKQLVAVGSEGAAGCLDSLQLYEKAHSFASIDYLTFHIWPKNWHWYAPNDPQKTLAFAIQRTLAYFERHEAIARKLIKPTTLEEFGLARDNEDPNPDASVNARHELLKAVFDAVEKSVDSGGPAAGTNIWSWGGEGRASNDEAKWTPGSDFTGDPPQEPQGLNSIFDTDRATLDLIREHAERLRKASPPRPRAANHSGGTR